MTVISSFITFSEKYQNQVTGLGIAYDGNSLVAAVRSTDTRLAVESVASIALRTLALVPAFNSDPTLKVVLINLNLIQSCYYIYKAYNATTSDMNRTVGLVTNLAFFSSQLHSLIKA